MVDQGSLSLTLSDLIYPSPGSLLTERWHFSSFQFISALLDWLEGTWSRRRGQAIKIMSWIQAHGVRLSLVSHQDCTDRLSLPLSISATVLFAHLFFFVFSFFNVSLLFFSALAGHPLSSLTVFPHPYSHLSLHRGRSQSVFLPGLSASLISCCWFLWASCTSYQPSWLHCSNTLLSRGWGDGGLLLSVHWESRLVRYHRHHNTYGLEFSK